ncbi:unnamed protein product [Acanthosepion pharaonis]|uniref:Uncharacterized protein n=1 Tax=Acanthosepion pharaonis TaxID=158019 RepID=A0A812D496_ACAPH|nr:unnamed protein product [Sepia pharaonis]
MFLPCLAEVVTRQAGEVTRPMRRALSTHAHTDAPTDVRTQLSTFVANKHDFPFFIASPLYFLQYTLSVPFFMFPSMYISSFLYLFFFHCTFSLCDFNFLHCTRYCNPFLSVPFSYSLYLSFVPFEPSSYLHLYLSSLYLIYISIHPPQSVPFFIVFSLYFSSLYTVLYLFSYSLVCTFLHRTLSVPFFVVPGLYLASYSLVCTFLYRT